jgi:peptidoglycan hydrolase CwlO-like protein
MAPSPFRGLAEPSPGSSPAQSPVIGGSQPLPLSPPHKPMDLDPLIERNQLPALSRLSMPSLDHALSKPSAHGDVSQQWKTRMEQVMQNTASYFQKQVEELMKTPPVDPASRELREEIIRLQAKNEAMRRRIEEYETRITSFDRERAAWTARFNDLKARVRTSTRSSTSSDQDRETIRVLSSRLEQTRLDLEREQMEKNEALSNAAQSERVRAATSDRASRLQQAVRTFTADQPPLISEP